MVRYIINTIIITTLSCGSEVQDKGVPEAITCRVLMFMAISLNWGSFLCVSEKLEPC